MHSLDQHHFISTTVIPVAKTRLRHFSNRGPSLALAPIESSLCCAVLPIETWPALCVQRVYQPRCTYTRARSEPIRVGISKHAQTEPDVQCNMQFCKSNPPQDPSGTIHVKERLRSRAFAHEREHFKLFVCIHLQFCIC